MATIANSNTAGELRVGTTNRAAGSELYDAAGNPVALPNSTVQPATQGFAAIAGRDDGIHRAARLSRNGGMANADMLPLLVEDVEGATINTQRWFGTSLTMNAAQTVSGITLNSGAITTTTTNYTLQSRKQFTHVPGASLRFRSRASLKFFANSVLELGFINTTGATIQSNGAYWQANSGGSIFPVIAYNNTEVTVGANIAGSINANNFYVWDVIVGDNDVRFVCQLPSTGAVISEQVLQIPAAQPRVWNAAKMMCGFRVYIAGVAPATAPQIVIGDCYVGQEDANSFSKPWSVTQAQMARSGILNPSTYAQTQLQTNSAEPASASLSNTSAGYTGLHGRFQFAAVAGAATDYCLFGFQIPAGYQFICTGIQIDTWNTGAASATTPTLLEWSIGVNSFGVSLTSSTPHLRHFVGTQSIPVAAAIGANVPQISKQFTSPLVCDSALFWAIILRMPVGTATASQVIAGNVSVEGYWE